MNVLNGGSHAGGRLAFQEFMIVPSSAPTFTEAMRQGAEVYQKLKSLAKKKYGQSAGNVGDEGGVAPDIETAEEALELITDAIEQAGYTGQMKIAMDVASSEFYKTDAKKYDLDFKNPESDPSKWITYEQLADQYKELASKYPIVSIEDPFADRLLFHGGDYPPWDVFQLLSLANLHRCVARRMASVGKTSFSLIGWTSPSFHLGAAVHLLSQTAKQVAGEVWQHWINSNQVPRHVVTATNPSK